MNPADLISDLDLSSRAYQVLYALGDTPSTVRTLTGSEAYSIVALATDIHRGHLVTVLDHWIAQTMSPHMMKYVAEGGFDA